MDPEYILGGQGNLWTEHLPTLRSAEYMTYPRACALAEDFWSPNDAKNWDQFIKRVQNQFLRFDAADINYSKAIYDPIVKSSMSSGRLMLEISSEVPGMDIYFTIDGTMPDNHSPKYKQSSALPDNPFTLRVISYINGKPAGHLITLSSDELKKRNEDWE